MNIEKKIKQYWDKGGKTIRDFDKIFPLGYAGTYADFNMQHLEMNAILKYINDGDSVADIGCGKGYGALYMAWKKKIKITGIDYSEEMIKEAENNSEQIKNKLKGQAEFLVGDVINSLPNKQFNLVYTERCLINLTTWEEQKKAIENISKLVKQGGLFIMQEGSSSSLEKLNKIRVELELSPIEVVWHNLFFEDDKLIEFAKGLFDFVKIDNFASMFTLISRALHPALIAPEEPSYKAEINKLALKLPNNGDYGYQKIYVFKKR